jgi:hypothetical protein
MAGIGKIAGEGVAATVKGVASVFAENREARGQRGHEADMAALTQFAAEFSARENRTWWDSFADGLNRIVRPLFALAAFFSMIAIPIWPERALYVAEALAAMPNGYWFLVGTIITFYFGGRMQVKSQDFKIRAGAVEAAKNIAAARRELAVSASVQEETVDEDAYKALLADDAAALPNWAIAEWNRRNKDGATN